MKIAGKEYSMKKRIFMSNLKSVLQGIAGFLPIFILWCVGAYFGDPLNEATDGFDTEEIIFSAVVPLFVVRIIPFIPIITAVIGKRFNLKILYISSLVSTALPVLASACSSLFSDDGNILSWIYAFTVGMLFYPFGRMCFSTFEGVDSYYFIYNDQFISRGLLYANFIIAIVLSLIIFRIVRRKRD